VTDPAPESGSEDGSFSGGGAGIEDDS